MEIKIERTYFNNGTNGVLYIGDVAFCHTIELPWHNNDHGTSCIPEGRYQVKKRNSPHLGEHLILLNVPNRDLILVHKANNALKELRGCIAPVTTLTGEGTGNNSGGVFVPLVEKAYVAIDKGEKVFITISKNP